jgi:hypothetical protein
MKTLRIVNGTLSSLKAFFIRKLKLIQQIIGPYNSLEIDKALLLRMVGNNPQFMQLERVI